MRLFTSLAALALVSFVTSAHAAETWTAASCSTADGPLLTITRPVGSTECLGSRTIHLLQPVTVDSSDFAISGVVVAGDYNAACGGTFGSSLTSVDVSSGFTGMQSPYSRVALAVNLPRTDELVDSISAAAYVQLVGDDGHVVGPHLMTAMALDCSLSN